MTRDQGFCAADLLGNLAGHEHWYPVGYFLFSWLVLTVMLSLDPVSCWREESGVKAVNRNKWWMFKTHSTHTSPQCVWGQYCGVYKLAQNRLVNGKKKALESRIELGSGRWV